MAGWDDTAASYNADLASRAGPGAPATLGEIWKTNWAASGLDTLSGSGKPTADAFNTLIDAATPILGPLPQAAKDRGLDYFGAPGFDGKAAVIGQMAATLPDEQKKALEPLLDFRARAAESAAKTESDAADVAGRTYGLSGMATGFLASVARQVVDPANVALLAATGPEAGGISAIARQALIAGAGQTVQEPVIQNNRAQLGLESGLGRAVEDVGQVAGGAIALPLLFRAAGWAAGKALGRAPVAPADFDAAALLADRDRVVAPPDPERLEAIAGAAEKGEVAPPVAEPDATGGEANQAPEPIEPEPSAARAALTRITSDAAEDVVSRSVQGDEQQTAKTTLGNPQLAADAQRALADAGGDFEIELGEGPAARRVSAQQALAEANEDAAAARELNDCIGGAIGEAAE